MYVALGLNFPTYGGVREGSLHASAGKVYVPPSIYLRFLLLLAGYCQTSVKKPRLLDRGLLYAPRFTCKSRYFFGARQDSNLRPSDS